MILIFAVDNNWNIGVNGDMLTSIPDDLTRFRLLTEENIVLMGRKTLEALPEQKPLPNRVNVLITRSKDYKKEGFQIVNSLEDLPFLLEKINPLGKMEVFVTGGGNIASQLLPKCNRAYITKIMKSFENADTCIPNLDLDKEWEIEAKSEIFKFNELNYRYINYVRV